VGEMERFRLAGHRRLTGPFSHHDPVHGGRAVHGLLVWTGSRPLMLSLSKDAGNASSTLPGVWHAFAFGLAWAIRDAVALSPMGGRGRGTPRVIVDAIAGAGGRKKKRGSRIPGSLLCGSPRTAAQFHLPRAVGLAAQVAEIVRIDRESVRAESAGSGCLEPSRDPLRHARQGAAHAHHPRSRGDRWRQAPGSRLLPPSLAMQVGEVAREARGRGAI